MKTRTFTWGLMLMMAVLAVMPQKSEAQLQANPNNFNYFYFSWLCNSSSTFRSYAANTVDTLPNVSINTWGNQTAANKSHPLGGASFLNLELITNDSLQADVYVDALLGNTWRNILTDSLIVYAADTTAYALRGTAVDKFSGLITERIRARISIRNVTQGITDGVDAATYNARWTWKP